MAQERAEFFRQQALDNQRRAARRPESAGVHCLSCHVEILESRRDALPECGLCWDCADRLERGMGR